MESKARFLGHPVHQTLIAFPVGLLMTGVVFDILQLVNHGDKWSTIAYYMIAAGVIGGLVAAIFGFVDYLAIPGGTRAKRIGGIHGLGNLLVVVLFASSWYLRIPDPSRPQGLALILSFVGVAVLAVTGWLGGELVDRLGVGVSDGANLDAPSSLSHSHLER